MLDVHPQIGLMPDTGDLNFYTAHPDLRFSCASTSLRRSMNAPRSY